MNFVATLAVALGALRVNKLRSALTMLGIIIGVGAVVAMVGIGNGAQAQIQEQIKSLGSNLIIVMSGTVTSGGVRLGSGSQLTISEDDAYAIQREIPEIQVAAPTTRGAGQVVAGNQNWSTVLQGVTPEFLEAREWDVEDGRLFQSDEVDGAAKVALLGQTVSRNLFPSGSPLGQTIRIRKVPFTVVGILDRKGQSLMGTDQDDVILVPISTARKRLLGTTQAKQRAVNSIIVKVREGADMGEAESQMRVLLRQRHRLQAGQDDDFSMRNLSEVLATRQAASKVMTLLLAAVASVSLVVGGIGIMNIMLVSVTERTREIGLRMAVGARRRDILAQFLTEATTLSLIGGAVGIALGLTASAVIAGVAEWPVVVPAYAVLLAFGFSAGVGMFFGWYPARKASCLEPIEALRYE